MDARKWLLFAVLAGCGARSIRADGDGIGIDGDGDADTDADADADADCGDDEIVSIEIERATTDSVDLLVLVDNSNSMREEQANLNANFGDIVRGLTNPPDRNGDGAPDWAAASSLHIGIISSDMGTSGYPVTTCDNANRGDDGVLQNLASPSVAGCDATYPKFLTYDVFAPDDNIAQDFECIATLGTGGCGFEQQLAAVEKALTVHAAAGAANDGFLRADALLAILMVTDEEDCSVGDPTIFGDDDSLGPLNLRCFNNPEMVRPVFDFVNTIFEIKPGRPDRIVVAGIVGVPQDLVALSESDLDSYDIQPADVLDDILNDPRMTATVDYSPEGGGSRLVPSCDVPGLGIAFPPRRIVELIREVETQSNNGIVQSICQADWAPVARAITTAIARRVRGTCLPVPITEEGRNLETGEHADCIVLETLADGSDCGPGKIEVGSDGGHTRCQICQMGDGRPPYDRDFRGDDVSECERSSSYWYYTVEDEACAGAGKIEFTDGAEPPEGAVIRLECPVGVMEEPPWC